MPKKYTDEILEKAYDLITNKGYSANKASIELGIDDGSMRKRLKEKYGQIFLPNGKKEIDSDFFNNIDTEEKAYWLGFLTADGYVASDRIELTLAEIDKEHLKLFKKSIKSKHAISKKNTLLNNKEYVAYRISFKDSRIVSNLNKHGLNNNKSYNAYIPFKNIPKEFIRHYIRGLFDGDGSIYNGANGINISIITASNQMAKDFYKVVYDNLNITMYIRQTRGLIELRLYSKNNVNDFLNWVYNDSTIYLARKYNKFKNADLGQKLQKS